MHELNFVVYVICISAVVAMDLVSTKAFLVPAKELHAHDWEEEHGRMPRFIFSKLGTEALGFAVVAAIQLTLYCSLTFIGE